MARTSPSVSIRRPTASGPAATCVARLGALRQRAARARRARRRRRGDAPRARALLEEGTGDPLDEAELLYSASLPRARRDLDGALRKIGARSGSTTSRRLHLGPLARQRGAIHLVR
jgi:hypothetical protein